MGLLGRIKDALLSPVNLSFGKGSGKTAQIVSMTPDSIGELVVEAGSDRPVWSSWNEKDAVEQGFVVSSWVYTCVHQLCLALSSIPIEVRHKISNNEWEKVDDADIAYLIENPNPFQSGSELKYHLALDLYLCGNAIINKVKVGGKTKELWRLSPDKIKPVTDSKNIISYYLFKNGREEKRIEAADIIHFKFPNPRNLWWGLSPLEAISKIIDTEVDAIESWRWSLRNRCVKDGILQFKEVLSPERYATVKSQLISQVATPQNSRLPLIIGNDSHFTATSMTPADMDFMNGRAALCREICAVLGVPLMLITQGESSTYNNMQEARLKFWQDTVIPTHQGIIVDTFNRCLMPEFGGRKSGMKLFGDSTDMYAMAKYFDAKVDTAGKMFTMGWSPNAINRRLNMGMDDLQYGGDFGYLQSNFLPLLNNPDSNDFLQPPTSPGGPPGAKPAGIGKPTTETGNPTRAITKRPKKNKSAAVDLFMEAAERDRQGKIKAAALAIKNLFQAESKQVEILFEQHGIQGALDAVEYNTKAWENTLDFFWLQVDAEDVMAAKKVEHIAATTKDQLRLINEKEGLTKEKIKSLYTHYANTRSDLIADVEVRSISNTLSDIKARRNNKIKTKTWRTMEDNLVRDSHAELDKVTIGIDDIFGNGCAFPGDSECGDLSEIINCRCSCSYN